MKSSSITSVSWLVSRLSLLAMFWLLSSQAHAACTAPATSIVTVKTSITLPRDTAIGTSLSDWVYSETTKTVCTLTGSQTWTTMGVNGLTDSGTRVTNDAGTSIKVYKTNVAGVGIAIQGRFTLCSSMSGWYDFNSAGWQSRGCNWTSAGGTHTIEAQIGVKYVVIGPMGTGDLNLSNPVYVNVSADSTDPVASSYFDTTSTLTTALACTTPDVTVDLGKAQLSAFAHSGDMSAPVAFTVRINGCSKDMSTVKYKLTSAQAQPTLPGVVATTSTSTATGFGVKIMKPDGTVLPIDGTKLDVSGYAKDVGGNLSIPMKASMYRIDATTATAGTLKAEVQFTMYYE
jgi:major type 1 subunit fimbrin (pilin)